MGQYLQDKRLQLLLFAILLALIPVIFKTYSILTGSTTSQVAVIQNITPTPIPIRVIDLTQGETTDFPEYPLGTFVTQKEAMCDQTKLDEALGETYSEAYKPLKYTVIPSLYGEENWWYQIRGTIEDIEKVDDKLKLSVRKGNTIVKTFAYPQKTRLGTDLGPSKFTLLKEGSLAKGDTLTYFATIKCRGERAAMLAPHTLLSVEFVEHFRKNKEASRSAQIP